MNQAKSGKPLRECVVTVRRRNRERASEKLSRYGGLEVLGVNAPELFEDGDFRIEHPL
jgi:hypothetical protein